MKSSRSRAAVQDGAQESAATTGLYPIWDDSFVISLVGRAASERSAGNKRWVSSRVPDELFEAVVANAARDDRSLSHVVRRALVEHANYDDHGRVAEHENGQPKREPDD